MNGSYPDLKWMIPKTPPAGVAKCKRWTQWPYNSSFVTAESNFSLDEETGSKWYVFLFLFSFSQNGYLYLIFYRCDSLKEKGAQRNVISQPWHGWKREERDIFKVLDTGPTRNLNRSKKMVTGWGFIRRWIWQGTEHTFEYFSRKNDKNHFFFCWLLRTLQRMLEWLPWTKELETNPGTLFFFFFFIRGKF